MRQDTERDIIRPQQTCTASLASRNAARQRLPLRSLAARAVNRERQPSPSVILLGPLDTVLLQCCAAKACSEMPNAIGPIVQTFLLRPMSSPLRPLSRLEQSTKSCRHTICHSREHPWRPETDHWTRTRPPSVPSASSHRRPCQLRPSWPRRYQYFHKKRKR